MPALGGDRPRPAQPGRKTQSHNQNGQKIGAKGTRTRQKLIDVTIALLETVGLRDVTVAEVAKVAGTSPATFYVYFEGVAEVVLAALESAEQVTPEMVAILENDFQGAAGYDLARRFVDAYVEQWQKHRTVFRVRNMAGEEGDARFVDARHRLAMPLIDALEHKIALTRKTAAHLPKIEPRAIAGTLLIMLERLGAVAPLQHGDDRTSADNMALAAAYLFHGALSPSNSV